MRSTFCVLVVVFALFALCACERTPAPLGAKLSVAQAMGGDADARFARAREPRELRFPDDHGPQPLFQTEWWYFTGNLADASGREFGCQVTFFRRATRFDAPQSSSAWSSRDVYMAHFALSDVAGGKFHAFERFERGALDLAGAQIEPHWRVWNRDWSASGSLAPNETTRLVAEEDGVRVELELRALTPPVLNGERGFSRKGDGDGAASYYYSLPRLEASGRIVVEGREHQVSGRVWFDREWSTSALEAPQVGWDWFALRLGDAGELMLYSMRRSDGARDRHASGTWTDARGVGARLDGDDFEIEVLDHWTSPRTGVRYPSRWRVRVPARELELELTPLLADQELDHAVRYWEGAVRIEGALRGARIDSRGYVELAGYGS